MSIRRNFENAALTFYLAHKAWKDAPEGPQKVDAKRAMGLAKSALIAMGDLYQPLAKKLSEP